MSVQRPGDPRNGAAYRTARATLRATTDRCHLCGHSGATTLDHLISVKDWYAKFGTYDGVNDPSNTDIAHGTGNECPECGVACNQARGAAPLVEVRSRDW